MNLKLRVSGGVPQERSSSFSGMMTEVNLCSRKQSLGMEWYCDAFIIVDSRGAAAATIQSPAMTGMSKGCMVIVIEGGQLQWVGQILQQGGQILQWGWGQVQGMGLQQGGRQIQEYLKNQLSGEWEMQLKYNNYSQHNHSQNNKNQGSIDARKSASSNARHDVLPYINLLDKCTQILREDRIWIRNQLKANDSQIIALFREARRPVNLQHLQIRLRKHVATVKSKAKMEQLMKFKENMRLGEYKPEKSEKSEPKKIISSSNQKYQLNSTSTFNRSKFSNRAPLQNRSTSYQRAAVAESNAPKYQRKPMIYPYRQTVVDRSMEQEQQPAPRSRNYPIGGSQGSQMSNSHNLQSAPATANFHDYPAPMEEITERQSENMTSARNRLNQDTNSCDGLTFGYGQSYTQWKRPNAPAETTHSKDPLEQIRAQFSKVGINSYQDHSEEASFEQGYAGKKIGGYTRGQNEHSNEKNQDYSGRQSISRKAPGNHSHQASPNPSIGRVSKQGSSRDPPHYNHPDFPSYREQEQYFEQSMEEPYQRQYNPLQGSVKANQNSAKAGSLHSYQSSNSPNQLSSHSHEQSQDTNLMQPFTYTVSQCLPKPITSSSKNNEFLFTSPELLAECRNFLKTKSSGKPTTGPGFDLQGTLKPLNLQFGQHHEVPASSFNADLHQISSNTFANHSESIQGSTMNLYNEISKNANEPHRDNYEYFHTFAAQSSQKKEEPDLNRYVAPENNFRMQGEMQRTGFQRDYMPQRDYQPEPEYHLENDNQPDYPEQIEPQSYDRREYNEEGEDMLAAEDLVNIVLQSVKNEPKGYIHWRTLEKIIEEQGPELMSAVREYLYDQQQLVMISNVGRVLEDLLQSQPRENDVRNIYRLLDIEQKGFILGGDIEEFVNQLEQSQAEDVQIISSLLWKLFDSINENPEDGQEKRIDYWSMYSWYMTPEFSNLNEILKQFEFQIE